MLNPSFIFSRADLDLDGPAIPAPSGSVSILDNPPNGNRIAIAIITLCTVLSVIGYLVRFYVKCIDSRIHISDYLAAVAFPIFCAYVYLSYRLSRTPGYLIHMWDIRLKEISAFSYVCFVATLLYFWIVALVKCAIMLEWTKIFSPEGIHRYLTWTWLTVAAAISGLSIVVFSMDLANCTPFEGNWNALLPARHCRFNVPIFAIASAACNVLLEIIPLILVQAVIWRLHLSWKKKLGVSFIFLIGITGCVSSSVRLYYSTLFYTSDDTTYYFSVMALCSLAEVTCANLILCVPCFPRAIKGFRQTKLFMTMRQHLTSKSDPSRNSQLDNSREPLESPFAAKQKQQWIMMNDTGSGNDKVYRDGSDEHTWREEV